MSAFLGPIHYWLYNKIQIQQELVDDVVLLGKDICPSLGQKLEELYGITERRPLDQVIDQGNIHGWLQELVSQVEYKLAYSITTLLKEDSHLIDSIKAVFYNKGQEKSVEDKSMGPRQVFQAISDSLLDGMPCDHANRLIEESDTKVIWERTQCVHKPYWNQVDGDISVFYRLRDEFIEGFLKGTDLKLEKLDEITSVLKKGGEVNE